MCPTMPTYQTPFKYTQCKRLEIRRQSWDLPHYLWAHKVLSTIRGGQRESQQEKTNRISKPGLLGTSEPKQVNFTQPVCQAPSMTWESTLRGAVRAPFSSLDPSSFPLPEVHSTGEPEVTPTDMCFDSVSWLQRPLRHHSRFFSQEAHLLTLHKSYVFGRSMPNRLRVRACC